VAYKSISVLPNKLSPFALIIALFVSFLFESSIYNAFNIKSNIKFYCLLLRIFHRQLFCQLIAIFSSIR